MSTLADAIESLGPEILLRTREHITLTFLAMLCAVIIAVPLGIYLARSSREKIVALVMGFVNLVQPIPSLALVALIVALFNVAGLPTIGLVPGLVALVAYALLPVVRNSYTGIRQVDPAVREVATGMGMTPRQILFHVELPLSLPVIMAGIRIATVWTIGVATLVSLVGAGGLGDLIFKGLRSYHIDLIVAGAAPAALLALVVDWLLAILEGLLTPGTSNTNGGKKAPKWLSALFSSARGKAAVLVVAGLLPAGFAIYQIAGGASSNALEAGFESEFLVRPDGYPGLKQAYDLEFPPPRHMDPGLMYRAAANGVVDVICGYSTDGRIPAYDLRMLEDDKNFFPPYYAAPLAREETLERYPELRELLNGLEENISQEEMQQLNYYVDVENRPPREVAREFLERKGLVSGSETTPSGVAGEIRIGGKNFTEQEIIGELLAILIEEKTELSVDRRLNLGGTMICFNALTAGDLDFYVEYTGTGLMSILQRDVINDPEEAYETVRRVFKERYDLVWLAPLGFNNTYTLTMRDTLAGQLGIESISDLAEVQRRRMEDQDF